MLKGIRTIIFDLGGVILNLNYHKTINAFQEIIDAPFETVYSQAQQSHLFDLFETGKISAKNFRNELCNQFNRSLSDTDFDRAWNAMLLDLPAKRIELIRDLSKHYQLLLFSNTNEIHLRAFQKIIADKYGNPFLLEEVFHKTYYSHVIGERKPNKSAFEYILEDQKIKAEEVLFIDDSEQHVLGAESLGIRAVHLKGIDVLSLFKNG